MGMDLPCLISSYLHDLNEGQIKTEIYADRLSLASSISPWALCADDVE